jgi:hypothetical protein
MPDDLITGFPTLTTEALLALVREHAWDKQPTGRRVPRYLSLAFCNVLTVYPFHDVHDALRAKRQIDQIACGHCCQKWHAILDLETRQYVTTSVYDLFTQAYRPLLNITARTSPLIVPVWPPPAPPHPRRTGARPLAALHPESDHLASGISCRQLPAVARLAGALGGPWLREYAQLDVS